MKILIVDDAKLIHFMVKKILNANDLTEIEYADAFDGEEGIEKAKSFQPDLILLDVVMPKKDGIEALKEIKEHNKAANVIMVSSLGTDEKVSEALKLGASAFIQKPFDDDELCTHVKNAK
ncbi:response regulator [Sulfurimonas sp. SAG-AH-194-C21]|nr:response regulator [Sulfurimonas sp. SAG-AH-194-C21]MDF1884053.1 response regulator [Sulfurimonas sp. SAG-AH-194-C21]